MWSAVHTFASPKFTAGTNLYSADSCTANSFLRLRKYSLSQHKTSEIDVAWARYTAFIRYIVEPRKSIISNTKGFSCFSRYIWEMVAFEPIFSLHISRPKILSDQWLTIILDRSNAELYPSINLSCIWFNKNNQHYLRHISNCLFVGRGNCYESNHCRCSHIE